ncbi:MAG: energy-coupling factor transporter transmembrane component T [Syntrophomonadaceae bacterium]
MKGMITGQYINGDSIIHRLDPRTKLLGCFAIIIAAAWPGQQIPILLFNIGFILLIIYLSQVGVVRVLRGLRTLRMLFLLTFICQVFFTPGDSIWNWGGIAVSRQGIYLGITTFLRLVILYLGSSLLTMTTSTLKLTEGLESLLSPLNYFRFPVHQSAMIINISLRFVPTIIEEAEVITRAQKSRGARFDSGPLALRLKTVLALMIPLLAATLQRATDLALAMESRCYAGGQSYSRESSMVFTWKDGIALGILVTIFLLPVWYGYVN